LREIEEEVGLTIEPLLEDDFNGNDFYLSSPLKDKSQKKVSV
jgi:8-oxo-dGTP pyrophosphatase MutT (NUDIX family)